MTPSASAAYPTADNAAEESKSAGTLARHRAVRPHPRRFLPETATLSNWAAIEPFFDQLEARDIDTVGQLEAWLADLSEFNSALAEEGSARYIEMTCATDDPAYEAAYLAFVTEIAPKTAPRAFALSRKYLASPARTALPPEKYAMYDRATKADVDLFREENVALLTEDETLSQQYQKACGEQTAVLRGEELTLPRIAKNLEETDRALRREAWTVMTARQMVDRDAMEDIFDRMVALRTKIAANAGRDNYTAYRFEQLHRFDYGPEACFAFHDAVEKHVVPLVKRLRERRKASMGLTELCPWDLAVDPEGLPPLRPFEGAAGLVAGADSIFAAVDPSFRDDFAVLRDRGLLDLESRKGKAPGGYQSSLDEVGLPFIFMNATGRNTDVFTLLHEGGHAFHSLAYRDQPLHDYRNAPIEFCEVASMGMEMMACERLESFYAPGDAARARRMHLEDVVNLLPWVARVDAFQHWMYANPGHTRAERAGQWLALGSRFGDDLSWPELPEWRGCSWISKLHFFCVPFYYIEYGIAQLGALQLWDRFLDDGPSAIAGYRRALALGASRPLPELFATAGLEFDFGDVTMARLMARMEAKLFPAAV